MTNLTNTLFFLLATPLQFLGTLILLPFAYGALKTAENDSNYYFLQFQEMQDTLRCHESFYGSDHPKTKQARADIRHFARRCVKEKVWDSDDIRMYLDLGIITQSDLKGLTFKA